MYACTLLSSMREIYAGIEYKIAGGKKYIPIGKGEDAKMLFFNEESPPQVKRKRVMGLGLKTNDSGKKELILDDPNNYNFCILIVGADIKILHEEKEGFETVATAPGAKLIILYEGYDIAMTVDGQKILLTDEKLRELIPD